MDMSAQNKQMTDDDINNITDQIVDAYGVNRDDVEIDVDYQVTGVIDVKDTDGISEADLIDALEKSIADALDVHDQKVNVELVDDEYVYTVVVDDYNESASLQDAMKDSSIVDKINDVLQDTLDKVSVQTVSTEEDIEVGVDVTVDASAAKKNLEKANSELTTSLVDEGYENVSVEGISFLLFFSEKI